MKNLLLTIEEIIEIYQMGKHIGQKELYCETNGYTCKEEGQKWLASFLREKYEKPVQESDD